MSASRLLAAVVLCWTLTPWGAAADEINSTWEQNLQVWVGGLDADDAFTRQDPQTSETLAGDLGTLPYFGGGSQRLWGDIAQIGFEGGGLVTFKSDVTRFYSNNGGFRLEVDNTLLSVDFYLGGVVSLRPVPWLRVYGAAGPTVAYAYLDDDDDDQAAPAAGSGVQWSSTGHAGSVTLYARGGVEFETSKGLTFGLQARYAPHEFDFGDSGELELDDVTYFLTIGQRL